MWWAGVALRSPVGRSIGGGYVRFVAAFRGFGWWRVLGAVGVVFERFWRAEMDAEIASSGLKKIKED
jgi:hypothetical protein